MLSSLFFCLFAWIILFTPGDFWYPTWVLKCGEEKPLLPRHVPLCRQDSAEHGGSTTPLWHMEAG